ncbi:MAG: short chain dehydrogenase family protein [Hyphomicrobiales bacterium]|nr:short chain dehydrogenase family protein [Hyphomicrobiales bacterium]
MTQPEVSPNVQSDGSGVLAGQIALVTGASSGIGRAIAIGLAQAGADVVVNYVANEDEASEVVRVVEAIGRRGLAVRADVGQEAQVQEMFGRTDDVFGRLDILVNNAGLQRDASFTDMTLADWDTVLRVNLTGQFLCSREAMRRFKTQERRPQVSRAAGKIICVSSVHEKIAWAGHANYAASKGGVLMMMQSLAQEAAPFGIRVNSIAPGAIRTPINREAWETDEAYAELMKLVPYGRIGEPEDIAAAAVWLASDASDYVVATTLFVDGGMTNYPAFAHGG